MKNIKAGFPDYAEIIDKIGEVKINERLCAIHDIYSEFVKETDFKDGKDIILNDRILMHTILDYFTDITRLKEFHDIDRINQDKIISYETSWILKRKPIQVLRMDKEELIYVNEKFVLGIFVNHLTACQLDDFPDNQIMLCFCDFLLYYLKYRNCDAKILETIISSFKAGNSVDKIKYE